MSAALYDSVSKSAGICPSSGVSASISSRRIGACRGMQLHKFRQFPRSGLRSNVVNSRMPSPTWAARKSVGNGTEWSPPADSCGRARCASGFEAGIAPRDWSRYRSCPQWQLRDPDRHRLVPVGGSSSSCIYGSVCCGFMSLMFRDFQDVGLFVDTLGSSACISLRSSSPP